MSFLPDGRDGPYEFGNGLPPIPVDETPSEVAPEDEGTRDAWVKRSPALVRLTGRHPFNCEARLRPLIDAGFLTPNHLHFVRNHGGVPQIDDATARNWRIRVHGLVETECSFSLQELRERFEVVTLPVTLVCAGNRRKEQNAVRQSLGFSWGAAGLSTALWTGVYLSDVIKYARPKRGVAKHVVFEGADNFLPNGPYGTSQLLSWAANKDKGMLIAWAMNGLPLTPDHGYPVRVIIPGQIGGRSVKWLTRIEISYMESQHHLHFHDNKVLPMQVTPEQARSEKHWWYDRSYLITELNVNSAISRPDHGETVLLPVNPTSEQDETSALDHYTVSGYAYAGGGRRITRVELSLDEGHTWGLAEITYPEDLYRSVAYCDDVFGNLDLTERDTSFCWCFWSFDVPLAELARGGSIAVRAMDEALSVQQRDMYLNATSMMNNWWFRVAIINDGACLKFEHPTLPGALSGGWMERMKAAGGDILKPRFSSASTEIPDDAPPRAESVSVRNAEVSMTDPEATRRVTRAELRARDPKKPWFVVRGEVYDGTEYLQEHPGGPDSILLAAGDDATDDFLAIHSADAREKLRKFHIGTLVEPQEGDPGENVEEDASCASPEFLHPKVWKKIELLEIRQANHDSYMFVFALPDRGQPLGLPVGQHVFLRLQCKSTGETIQRAYTPVSHQDVRGSIEFLIKLYLPNAKFPSGGKMSQALKRLRAGDILEIKGPVGSFTWQGSGSAMFRGQLMRVREIGMICGGSGITPILQVLRAIVQNPLEETRVWVLDANRTEADILCHDELQRLQALWGDRLRVHHTLTAPPGDWTYSAGRVNATMMRVHLPAPSPQSIVLTCGPPGMIADTVRPGLTECGWDVERSLIVF